MNIMMLDMELAEGKESQDRVMCYENIEEFRSMRAGAKRERAALKRKSRLTGLHSVCCTTCD